MSEPEEIVAFWLHDVGEQGWYTAADEVDAEIRARFLPAWEAALEGGREFWLTGPRGALAYLILTEGAGGLSPADAAYRAGRAAALRDKKSVERARKVLDALPAEAVDEASQRLLQALGADIIPDGAFGEGSKSAYQSIAAEHGDTSVEADPIERLIDIARIHWSTTPFRVDLY